MKFEINLEKDFQIKLSSHTINVKFIDEAIFEDHGAYDPKTCTIFLNKNGSYPMVLSSFIHELIHAVEHVYTLELDHIELNLVAESITQVFVDNFKLK